VSDKKTVLVVDDEPGVLKLIETCLLFKGYTVLTARNGLEALSFFRLDVDVLITDLVMPEMDGHKLVLRVREKRPNLPVIVISGCLDVPIPDRCTVVKKPFKMADLLKALDKAIGTSSI
jgi:two-component system cell cycle sensor histidine kinase/response regulator CckA